MPEFKKYGRPGGNRPRPFNGNSSSREVFDVNCNNCQERCQVPFRPNGKKPVYCSNCFKKEERGSAPSYGPRNDYKSDYKKDFERRPARAPFESNNSDRQIEGLKKQLETMNATLERLAKSIDSINRAAELSSEVRKHIPEVTPEEKKAPAAKKVAKKAATKAAKKPAKKAAKK